MSQVAVALASPRNGPRSGHILVLRMLFIRAPGRWIWHVSCRLCKGVSSRRDGLGAEHDSPSRCTAGGLSTTRFFHTRALDIPDERRAVCMPPQQGSASFFLPFTFHNKNLVQLSKTTLSPDIFISHDTWPKTLCHQPQWQPSGSPHMSQMRAISASGTVWRTSRRCKSTRIVPVSDA